MERLKVYVAGASKERYERAIPMMERLRAGGVDVTHDWTVGMTGAPDSSLSLEERAQYAAEDIRGVLAADVVAFLAPLKGASSIGAWVELGIALGAGKPVFAAGDTTPSIFGELPAGFPDDESLARALLEPEFMKDWVPRFSEGVV